MRFFFVAISALAISTGSAQAASGPSNSVPCDVDRAAMLAMPWRAFDSTLGSGWRVLVEGRPSGCERAAADLIAAYRAAHEPALGAFPLRTLNWHEAQLRAAAGETSLAIDRFNAARAGADEGPAYQAEQNILTDATIAFLKADRRSFDAARAAYLAISAPADFQENARQAKIQAGVTLTWPPNLDNIDEFAGCFGKSYSEAYGDPACRKIGRQLPPPRPRAEVN